MAVQNMIMKDKLLAFVTEREEASWANLETLDEYDSCRHEEQAILDTLELVRRFVEHETGEE